MKGFHSCFSLTWLCLCALAQSVIADPLDQWIWRRSPAIVESLNSVTYGNGTFVAVGTSGSSLSLPNLYNAIQSSSDGVNWTSRASAGDGLSAVAYGNGTFVAVGRYGTILTSRDGVTWTSRTSGRIGGSPYSLSGVTYGNGTFVAVGERGAILQTPMLNPVVWLVALPNALFQINVAASPGKICGIQTSTNLVDWLLLTNLITTDATVQFTDFGATNFSRRFYRAVLP